MKRTLIAVTLAGLALATNAVFADATVFSNPGDATTHEWKNAPETTSYQADSQAQPGGQLAREQSSLDAKDGIYSFNP